MQLSSGGVYNNNIIIIKYKAFRPVQTINWQQDHKQQTFFYRFCARWRAVLKSWWLRQTYASNDLRRSCWKITRATKEMYLPWAMWPFLWGVTWYAVTIASLAVGYIYLSRFHLYSFASYDLPYDLIVKYPVARGYQFLLDVVFACCYMKGLARLPSHCCTSIV